MNKPRNLPLSRRTFLAALGAATVPALGAEAPRKLGLIFPPAGRGVPEEGLAMYGDRIEYVIENLGLATMTPEGYDAVLDRPEKLFVRFQQRPETVKIRRSHFQ